MRALLQSRRAPLALQIALGLVAVVLASSAPGRDAPPPRLAYAATGALAISNSKAGAMIFRGNAMRPGQAVSGDVRIGNAGSARALLRLSRTSTGGPLDGVLQLHVIDQTNRRSVYAGPAAMRPIELGAFAPGERRNYQFVATLPGGAGNAYQGASLSQNFTWTAREAPVKPAPTTRPAPRPGMTPAPAVVTPGSVIKLPSARGCLKRRFIRLRLRVPRGMGITKVVVRVGKGKRRRYGPARRRIKLPVRVRPGRKIRVRVKLHRSTGSPLKLSRRYRACKRVKR